MIQINNLNNITYSTHDTFGDVLSFMQQTAETGSQTDIVVTVQLTNTVRNIAKLCINTKTDWYVRRNGLIVPGLNWLTIHKITVEKLTAESLHMTVVLDGNDEIKVEREQPVVLWSCENNILTVVSERAFAHTGTLPDSENLSSLTEPYNYVDEIKELMTHANLSGYTNESIGQSQFKIMDNSMLTKIIMTLNMSFFTKRVQASLLAIRTDTRISGKTIVNQHGQNNICIENIGTLTLDI